LLSPDAGSVTIEGYGDPANPDVRQRIGVAPQALALYDALTGDENLRRMGMLSGLGRAAAARRSRELLDRFELAASARKRVKTYSGGMRRRLDLAISLLTTPPVVFLDEPTTGLDPASRQELWRVIRHLADNGTTVLLTTQYLEEADQLADRIAVLEGGRIVAVGSPGDLKRRIGGEMVAVHDAEGEVLREIPTDGSVAGLRAALDELDDPAIASVSLRSPSLDDVFLALTGKDAK
jgi:ABC-2 type transport system ATP-binding protein